MPLDELRYHECEKDESWAEYDYYGIYVARVCDKCKEAKLKGYRKEIFTGPYEANEPIEPEDEDYYEPILPEEDY